ncbi:hypothetical protein L596_005010 [Steinernema carpocapsae]|uniref:Uncharacterized protein n=1 Tax=Steinernema carpocapsae TaxID=34508 RepID=A0A4V6I8B6_STECR|nr:hypothetical protein L596_005010 [Steinernema carpocapsae]
MSSFADDVGEGGSDEFSDGIDDVSADESEGFYEEQNAHRMWRKASLSEQENDAHWSEETRTKPVPSVGCTVPQFRSLFKPVHQRLF